MKTDLLHDPLITLTLRGSPPTRVSLPEVLAALVADSVDDFPALRPHQEHPWYSFLVQVAAIALHGSGAVSPPLAASDWRRMLEGLAPQHPTAWTLVVADTDAPAFLQPPIPDGLGALGKSVSTPDELDLLVLSKNHDLKAARVPAGDPELWLYALLSLQTMDGYQGIGNYNIARMSSGHGSRPLVGAAPALRWGRRFIRDLDLLVAATEGESPSGIVYDPKGPALLWLEPWDGSTSRPLAGLHPWFIEICRRVRLVLLPNGNLKVRKGASKVSRLVAKDQKGHVGDPWIPIEVTESKALTLSGASGFNYKQVTRLLGGKDFRAPLCGQPQRGDALLLLNALVRGEGKTEGFHERAVPVPVGRFGATDWRERFARRAKQRIEKVDAVRVSVLLAAIRTLFAAGETQSGPAKDRRPQRFLDAFEHDVDEAFFPMIWRALDAPDEAEEAQAEHAFQQFLHSRARAHLEAAIDSAPLPAARRYKAIAAAEAVFHAGVRKALPNLSTAAPAASATESA